MKYIFYIYIKHYNYNYLCIFYYYFIIIYFQEEMKMFDVANNEENKMVEVIKGLNNIFLIKFYKNKYIYLNIFIIIILFKYYNNKNNKWISQIK